MQHRGNNKHAPRVLWVLLLKTACKQRKRAAPTCDLGAAGVETLTIAMFLACKPLSASLTTAFECPHIHKGFRQFALMESPAEHASGSQADPITLRLVKEHLF